jgi:hypothetical protein
MAARLWCLVVRGIRGLWNGLKFLGVAVWPTRVSLGLILAGTFMLLVHEQGQDLAIRLVETATSSDGALAWSLFFVATLWWSIQSWLWARIACNQHFGPLRETDADGSPATLPIRWVGEHEEKRSHALMLLVAGLPRIYAAAVFGLAVLAIWRAGGVSTAAFWIFSAAGIGVGLALWFRHHLLDRVQSHMNWLTVVGSPQKRLVGRATDRIAIALVDAADADPLALDDLFGATPAARFLTKAAAVVALVMAAAVCIWPGARLVGAWLGAPAGTFIAFASILPALGIIAGLSQQLRFPLLASLFVLAVLVPVVGKLLVWSGVTWFVDSPWLGDHHRIPVVAADIDKRRDLATTWNAWKAVNPGAADVGKPIVFTASAGGGVRAALWTAVVLDRARAYDKNFDDRHFAVSGVSGGALGATAYLVTLSTGAAPPSQPCDSTATPGHLGPLGKLGFKLFTADMLGPTFAAAFYGDLLFTFVPFPAPMNSATALTESWEVAWQCVSGVPDGFSRPLLKHFTGNTWRPVVLLNGTHVETGKRLITTDLKLATTSLRDAWDFHAITGGDLSTSMAALNAARFPGVVAAGTVTTVDGRRWGHVIDGGYFENSGGLAALELAGDVVRQAAKDRAKLKPIFIEILSDPDAIERDYRRLVNANGLVEGCGKADKDGNDAPANCVPGDVIEFLLGLSGPINGILNTRDGHGVWSPWLFRDFSQNLFPEASKPTYFQFRLCPHKQGARVPLGWQLSDHSANDIVDSLPMADPGVQEPPDPKTATKQQIESHRRWQCERDNFHAMQDLAKMLTGR